MHSVIEHDDNVVDDGKMVSDAINQNFSEFIPDMMFDNLAKDFSIAKNLYGERLLRLVTGYSPGYLQKNINIPEFKRELKEKINQKGKELKEKGLTDKDGKFTKKAIKLSSLILYTEELDHLIAKGVLGKKITKNKTGNDEIVDYRNYKKGDSYKTIAIRKSLRKALRRNHTELKIKDMSVKEEASKGKIYLIYALDASGSMKGKKIEAAKKAGIALSFKAIEEKDPVGLMVFGSEVKEKIAPTLNFPELLETIARIRASRETDIAQTIEESLTMFPKVEATKHLILLTDAMPTKGADPKKKTLEQVGKARSAGITISLIGINLDDEAFKFARELTEIGNGRIYRIKDIEELDTIILEEYERL